MAQTRRTTTSRTHGTNRKQNTNRQRNAYVYDNTARRLDVRRKLEEEPKRQLSNETRKNRDKARHMSLPYVLFLMVAACSCGFILVNYIQLQSELTNRVKNIASLESQLNNMRVANDEEYSRITSSIDLEEIKRIAIGELGMTYAEQGQIVTYTNDGNDYMRRVTETAK